MKLQRIVNQVLTHALSPAERTRIGTMAMIGRSHHSGAFTKTNHKQP